MLVVSNGAFKSGSTWLFNILTSLRKLETPDEAFLTKGNAKHPSVAVPRLSAYIAGGEFTSRDIITKNHLAKPEHRALLLANENVRVFCMTRDTRDVMVSAYYHDLRKQRFEGSFAKYYWEEGRELLPLLMRYRAVWAAPHPQVASTSFEALKSDFAGEVARIAAVLEVPAGADDIDRIRKANSIDALRDKYQDAPSHRSAEGDFFRKGESGDWQNHFDDKILADHDRVCRDGIPTLDRHYLLNRLRQKVRRALA